MYQPSNITPVDQIQKELEEMQSFLEAHYSADNINQVQDRFENIGVYMARSGKLKADAEHHYNSLVESSIMEALKRGYENILPTTTLNKFVEAEARNYKFLLTFSDRVNRSCTHQYEGLRTVISMIKAEKYSTR